MPPVHEEDHTPSDKDGVKQQAVRVNSQNVSTKYGPSPTPDSFTSKQKKPISIKTGKSEQNMGSALVKNKPSEVTIVTQQLNSDFDKLLSEKGVENECEKQEFTISTHVISKSRENPSSKNS